MRLDRAQIDEQRGGGSRMERDLKGLSQLRVELAVGPAGEPRDQNRVGRGGDRQQLGRTVCQPEHDGVAKWKRRPIPQHRVRDRLGRVAFASGV
jgi:hypothetical protein